MREVNLQKMDRYNKVFLVVIMDQLLLLPWIKMREVNLWKMDRYNNMFFGGDNRPDTDFVLHKQEGSECTENGQV